MLVFIVLSTVVSSVVSLFVVSRSCQSPLENLSTLGIPIVSTPHTFWFPIQRIPLAQVRIPKATHGMGTDIFWNHSIYIANWSVAVEKNWPPIKWQLGIMHAKKVLCVFCCQKTRVQPMNSLNVGLFKNDFIMRINFMT